MEFSQIQRAISQCYWQFDFQDFNFQPNDHYIPNIVCDYAWQPPPEGWVKLNVDGSCLGNPGDASAGGLLRDASSNWLLGFGFNIGETSVLAAELIGISFGLQLAWLNGFRRVIVESDSLKAVKLINNERDISLHPLAALIQDCRRLMKMDWDCYLSHIYREQNFCADSLAKQSHGLQIQELAVWDSPPWKVYALFRSSSKFFIDFLISDIAWSGSADVFSHALAACPQLDLFDIIAQARPAAHLTAKLPTRNPDAPSMIDRMLRILPCYSLLTCSLQTLDDNLIERRYGLSPTGQLFVRNKDGDFNFQPNDHYIPNIVCDYAWQPPPEGWVKLNVDGSCLGNPGDASAGGLLRDASSNWLLGFGFNIGETSVLAAELIGISFGLQLAWLNGFRRVIVESDSLKAVKLINNERDISLHPLALIQDCRRLMKMDWDCYLSHIYREQNFCADSLAKQSHGLQIQELAVWDSPPWKVLRFLNDDKLGVSFRRVFF
ncbi:hypothetical protein GH714_011106 [Hevea brasiliensis]|uniref:RNase H type-1 domain-containing protein n=1 Tax=Hevea brasiliensis TaxID=3981 RepID=A0A6A6NBP6_HEVBR|nr:hypothetical protein GH714_011106 [Hevea brasiliensis]